MLLAIASVWDDRKGFGDFISLRNYLSDKYVIVLVGINDKQRKMLPYGIIGIQKTNNQTELAQLYTMATVLLSLSRGETFGMTMAEAYACGTPAIVYDNTTQPEIISPETGRIAVTGDLKQLAKIVDNYCEELQDNAKKKIVKENCQQLAEKQYENKSCFEKYIKLYTLCMKEKRL